MKNLLADVTKHDGVKEETGIIVLQIFASLGANNSNGNGWNAWIAAGYYLHNRRSHQFTFGWAAARLLVSRFCPD